MTTYAIRCHDGGDTTIEADDVQDLLRKIDDCVAEGDWGDDGASVGVWYALASSPDDETHITVEVEPHDDILIARAMAGHDSCGDDPDDHEWEGVGGCDENPGCFGGPGTTLTFVTRCTKCGLRCRRVSLGMQRNPGDHDTVEYRPPEG